MAIELFLLSYHTSSLSSDSVWSRSEAGISLPKDLRNLFSTLLALMTLLKVETARCFGLASFELKAMGVKVMSESLSDRSEIA